jgi:hypothetical protein
MSAYARARALLVPPPSADRELIASLRSTIRRNPTSTFLNGDGASRMIAPAFPAAPRRSCDDYSFLLVSPSVTATCHTEDYKLPTTEGGFRYKSLLPVPVQAPKVNSKIGYRPTVPWRTPKPSKPFVLGKLSDSYPCYFPRPISKWAPPPGPRFWTAMREARCSLKCAGPTHVHAPPPSFHIRLSFVVCESSSSVFVSFTGPSKNAPKRAFQRAVRAGARALDPVGSAVPNLAYDVWRLEQKTKKTKKTDCMICVQDPVPLPTNEPFCVPQMDDLFSVMSLTDSAVRILRADYLENDASFGEIVERMPAFVQSAKKDLELMLYAIRTMDLPPVNSLHEAWILETGTLPPGTGGQYSQLQLLYRNVFGLTLSTIDLAIAWQDGRHLGLACVQNELSYQCMVFGDLCQGARTLTASLNVEYAAEICQYRQVDFAVFRGRYSTPNPSLVIFHELFGPHFDSPYFKAHFDFDLQNQVGFQSGVAHLGYVAHGDDHYETHHSGSPHTVRKGPRFDNLGVSPIYYRMLRSFAPHTRASLCALGDEVPHEFTRLYDLVYKRFLYSRLLSEGVWGFEEGCLLWLAHDWVELDIELNDVPSWIRAYHHLEKGGDRGPFSTVGVTRHWPAIMKVLRHKKVVPTGPTRLPIRPSCNFLKDLDNLPCFWQSGEDLYVPPFKRERKCPVKDIKVCTKELDLLERKKEQKQKINRERDAKQGDFVWQSFFLGYKKKIKELSSGPAFDEALSEFEEDWAPSVTTDDPESDIKDTLGSRMINYFIPSSARYGESFQKILDNGVTATTKLNSLIERGTASVDDISGRFKRVGDRVVGAQENLMKILSSLIYVVPLIAIILLSFKYPKIAFGIANVAGILWMAHTLDPSLWSALKEHVGTFLRWAKVSKDTYRSAMGEEMPCTPQADFSGMPGIGNVIALTSLFYVGGTALFPTLMSNGVAKTLMAASRFDSTMKSWDTISSTCVGIVETAVNLVRKAFGWHAIQLRTIPIKLVADWAKEVEIMLCRSDIGKGWPEGNADLEELVTLRERGSAFLIDLKLDKETRFTVERLNNKLHELCTAFGCVFANAAGMRMNPVMFCIYGEPGIGKTMCLNYLCNWILLRVLPRDRIKQLNHNLMSEVFSKGASEFWEGYLRQTIMMMDDLGQVPCCKGSTNNELIEVIKCVNVFQYPLNFAALENKGKRNFNSPIVGATTNHKVFSGPAFSEAIVYPEALIRRVDLPFQMQVKKGWTDEVLLIPGDEDEFNSPSHRPISKDKIVEHIQKHGCTPEDAWVLTEWDFDKGHRKSGGKTLSLKGLADVIVTTMRERTKRHSSVTDHTIARNRVIELVTDAFDMPIDTSYDTIAKMLVRMKGSGIVGTVEDMRALIARIDDDFNFGPLTPAEIVGHVCKPQTFFLEKGEKLRDFVPEQGGGFSVEIDDDITEERFKELHTAFQCLEGVRVGTVKGDATGRRHVICPKYTWEEDGVIKKNFTDVFCGNDNTYDDFLRVVEKVREKEYQLYHKFETELIESYVDGDMPTSPQQIAAFATYLARDLRIKAMVGLKKTLTTVRDHPLTPWVGGGVTVMVIVAFMSLFRGWCSQVKDPAPVSEKKLEPGTISQIIKSGVPQSEVQEVLRHFRSDDFVLEGGKSYAIRPEAYLAAYMRARGEEPCVPQDSEDADQHGARIVSGYGRRFNRHGKAAHRAQGFHATLAERTHARYAGIAHGAAAPSRWQSDEIWDSSYDLLDEAVKSLIEGDALAGKHLFDTVPLVYRDDKGSHDIGLACSNNSFQVHLTRGGEKKHKTYMLFIRDQLGVINHHYWHATCKRIDSGHIDAGEFLTFQCMGTKTYSFTYTAAKFRSLKTFHMPENDATFIRFENNVRAMRDIVDYFVLEKHLPELTCFAARMETYFHERDRSGPWHRTFRATLRAGSRFAHGGEDLPSFSLRRSVEYPYPSLAGECGSPIFVEAKTHFGCHRLIGIHCLGDGATVGACNVLTCEIINAALTKFPGLVKTPQVIAEGNVRNFTEKEKEEIYAQSNLKMDAEAPPLISESFIPLAVLVKPLSMSAKSTLVSTPLKNAWGVDPRRPAQLRPFKLGNGWVHPMAKAVEKYKGGPGLLSFDERKLAEAAHVAYRPLMELTASEALYSRHILTFEEAVRGSPELDLPGINRRTTPGYPWNTRGYASKKRMFGSGDEYCFDSPEAQQLRKEVEEVIEKAKRGERSLHVYTDFLKDELRTVEKVRAGKTRLISGAPVAYTIAFRMYYGSFISACLQTKIRTGIAVGVDHNRDWGTLKDQVIRVGNNVIAGDFSGWDASLQSQYFHAIRDMINKWYGDEHAAVRNVLWLEVTHSVHLGGIGLSRSMLYTWAKSLPSGHPITSLINSLYNLLVWTVAWGELAGREALPRFWDFVSPVVYGDDNIVGVADCVKHFFNQGTVTEAFKLQGMEYTEETKTGIEQLGVRRIEECAFLKRGFRYDDVLEQWVAPLSLDTALFIPYWCHDVKQLDTIVRDNVETCLMELALHPQDVWDTYAPKIEAAALSCLSYPTRRLVDRRTYGLAQLSEEAEL